MWKWNKTDHTRNKYIPNDVCQLIVTFYCKGNVLNIYVALDYFSFCNTFDAAAVAVKIIHPAIDFMAKSRFYNEPAAEITAKDVYSQQIS